MISILMPAKNAEKYIEACIDSILNQTFKEWELLVVNDGSSDQTEQIVKNYESQDLRIQLLQNKGNGIIDALHTAFKASKGNYIGRMDADDIMHEQKLELQIAKLVDNPGTVVTNKVKYFSDRGMQDGYLKYERWLNELIDQESHYSQIYKECVLPSPSWLMERSTLLSVGGFENLIYPEDYDLCFKLYEKGIPITGICQTLHFWRDYDDRTSRTSAHYADNRFLELKVRYFLSCDHDVNSTLCVYGAGKKGKKIAQLLIEAGAPFKWFTNNESKLNAPIYGQQLFHENELTELRQGQVIYAIAQKTPNHEVLDNLSEHQNIVVFPFC